MDAPTLEARLSAVAAAVETALDGVLSGEPGPGEIARPARLLDAMRYAMLGGGKRLRPALAVMTGALLAVDPVRSLRAGLAVECVHGYSLIHDDLPSMDDDALRRGRPTLHRAYDEATAILAGDALLTLAFDLLADPATHPDAGVRIALVTALARAAGLGGMVGGQMLDLAAEGRFSDGVAHAQDETAVLRMQSMKTGALIAAPIAMAAELAGAAADERAALSAYASALGAAFQVADDLLDAEGSEAAVGKATGKDAEAGKATLVGLLGPEGARARLAALVDAAVEALTPFGLRAAELQATARFVAERSR
ncbi:geranylgeranyl pyrophosphate synthase [Methylopila jiangsuensis]|uniref:Probable farnesyl diphosphate synthase n=1 Tax=Methylopila jiangsuensis TaxID=586230 RepID=A0A9W6N4E5_9HYPH|nr:farnesyl diphosphate synthase [Methylopila jiangsuensis]MDR6286388.1 farnesyl diphosphate synthase [Methylopila jiangsuensis]GLK77275.1 geranylgeranyl pyrophosphate synthase [Methylopila jiangsuensis]